MVKIFKLEKSPKNLPDLIKQIAAGNIDLHELKRMQNRLVYTEFLNQISLFKLHDLITEYEYFQLLFRQKDLESEMDRLKVLEGESEAFSFFKTQEDEDEKAKKKKDCFIISIKYGLRQTVHINGLE